MNTKKTLRIMFVEDLETDKILAEREIKKSGLNFTSVRVDSEKEFLKEIPRFKPDIIISDYSMPSFDGMSALEIVLSRFPEIPFIILTGSMNEDTAVECMKIGASDYVIKEHINRLPYAISEALNKNNARIEKEKYAKELIQSEERYRFLFENNPHPMWVYDMETLNFLAVNDTAIDKYGYSREEFSSMNLLDIRPEDDRDKLIHNVETAQLPIQSSGRWRHRLKNGTVIYVEIFSHSINFMGKKARLVIANDITEKVTTEQALFESEKKFRNLFENHSAIKLIIDPDNGNIVDANQAAAAFYGWTIDKLIKMNIADINTLSAAQMKIEIERARTSQNIHFEFKHRKADGSLVDVETFSSKVIIGEKDYLHSIIHDVTEKKSAQAKLNLLSRAIEDSPISIVITEPHGRIEYVNPKFTEVTGYTMDEVLGKTSSILKSGTHENDFYEDLWDTILSGKTWKGELKNKKKNGKIFWESCIISPIINSEGDIINFIAVKEDITEKKNMIAKIIKMKEEAEAASKLKTEFLAQMSHEIRTPLNAILNYSAIIKEEMENCKNEEVNISFTGLESASKRIIKTIDSILNMSELQLGTYRTTSFKIELVKFFDDMRIEYKWMAEAKKLRLSFNTRLTSEEIEIDDYALHQIFANLIENGIKYTNEGFVEIRLKKIEKGCYKIEVEDSGIGISENYIPELFTAFSQEEKGYSRKFEGNGLGLALVKNYCDMIGAEISVESTKNVGTKFCITIKNTGNA